MFILSKGRKVASTPVATPPRFVCETVDDLHTSPMKHIPCPNRHTCIFSQPKFPEPHIASNQLFSDSPVHTDSYFQWDRRGKSYYLSPCVPGFKVTVFHSQSCPPKKNNKKFRAGYYIFILAISVSVHPTIHSMYILQSELCFILKYQDCINRFHSNFLYAFVSRNVSLKIGNEQILIISDRVMVLVIIPKMFFLSRDSFTIWNRGETSQK